MKKIAELDRFTLLKNIPVKIRKANPKSYIASFLEADIHMSGESVEIAIRELKEYIEDHMDLLVEKEDVLGVGPKKRLEILRQYLKNPQGIAD